MIQAEDIAGRMNAVTKSLRPNRRRGYCSPLDRLPASIAAELVRRYERMDTFRELKEWLAKRHGVKTSQTSLHYWSQRRKKEREMTQAPAPKSAKISTGKFEITISAAGAGRVEMKVRQIEGTACASALKGRRRLSL